MLMLVAMLLAAAGPLADEEAVLSRALAVRAQAMEAATGIRFTAYPRAELERLSFGGRHSARGQYDVERGVILLSHSVWYGLNVSLKQPLRLAQASAVAADASFADIADHELGHALADQVSRRHGLGPWYTPEHMRGLQHAEAMGLTVLSEGVGTHFQRGGRPDLNQATGEWYFPAANDPLMRAYTLDLVAYRGGGWLVHPILRNCGERGLVWLIAHPLALDAAGDMRAAATAYRERALRELSCPAS